MALIHKTIELSTGVFLPYVEKGDPAVIPVLFLHGFLDSWHSFSLVLPHLPEPIHSFSVTQRGHGDASRPSVGYSIVDSAADLGAFMNALNLAKAVVVGHSMGSAVALRFAIDHPERIAGLVLIGASSTLASTPAARSYWNATLSGLTDPIDSALVRQIMESALVQPVPQEFLDTAMRETLKVPSFVWREAVDSRWRQEGDFSGQLSHVSAPTLIMWGDRDARYARSEQDALASEMKDAELVTYSGAGHMLHWYETLNIT